jgi:hypothetical protein
MIYIEHSIHHCIITTSVEPRGIVNVPTRIILLSLLNLLLGVFKTSFYFRKISF